MPTTNRRHQKTLRWWFAAFVALGLFGFAPATYAQDIIADGSRPLEFDFSLGPAIRVQNANTQFKMTQLFGVHFMGSSRGPALGISTQEAFGNDWFTFEVGPQFWWDIQVIPDRAFYIAPFAQMGYAVVSVSYGTPFFGGSATAHFFNLQFGARAKVILNDRLVLYFQPFSMNMYIGDTFAVRFDLQVGVGVTF